MPSGFSGNLHAGEAAADYNHREQTRALRLIGGACRFFQSRDQIIAQKNRITERLQRMGVSRQARQIIQVDY
jgi:hypothetical protein